MSRLQALVEFGPRNAAFAWVIVALVGVGGAVSLVTGDLLWAVYSAAVLAVALVAPAVARDHTVLPAWPLLALAGAPILVRWAGIYVEFLSYLSVAALSLLVVLEVHALSSAEMPPWFAVLFVVLTTMTLAGLWGVLQYFSDLALGTSFLAGRTELMWDLVAATAAGIGAGVLFEAFFRNGGLLAEAADEVLD